MAEKNNYEKKSDDKISFQYLRMVTGTNALWVL